MGSGHLPWLKSFKLIFQEEGKRTCNGFGLVLETGAWITSLLIMGGTLFEQIDVAGASSQGHETRGNAGNHFDVPLIECNIRERRMNEAECTHTFKTHGASVARTHMHDWLILLLLVVIEVVLYLMHPFYRFVGKDMMVDLKYPFKSNTVPVWAVPIYAMLLPMVIFIIIYIRRRDVYDLHHATLGLLFSVLVTSVITNAIKNAVGRPRPDFFWRCFPDGKDVYDQLGNVICSGAKNVVKEGHKSFPSGHTSWSFAGLGFLSLYLAGKIKAFDRRGHVAKLCLVFLPLLFATLVGISRVDDYWHHWQDVFAGGLLGLVVSAFFYLQFFPPPYHVNGWGPYAYFRMLEELRASSSRLASDAQANVDQEGRRGNDRKQLHLDPLSSSFPAEDVESRVVIGAAPSPDTQTRDM